MKKFLVGYTGFVGSNLVLQQNFDSLYNSKNIIEAYNTQPDLLVYSGVKAEKFLANKEPEKDYLIIKEAIQNIQKINPKVLVLISTIDVYKKTSEVNEDTIIDTENLHPYGLNRYLLEKWIEDNIKEYLIVRLPALYGKNIKKNFIYDLINIIPLMLTEEKFQDLYQKDSYLNAFYTKLNNGFYKCNNLSGDEQKKLRVYFNRIGFNALNFTDDRASFQFYNLAFLWSHIEIALKNKIKKINITTEPITAQELYKHIKQADFINQVSASPSTYNIQTKYAELYKGKNNYIFTKDFIKNDISLFIQNNNMEN